MIKISQTIVVEGKDDVSAVKRAVDADVISTSGMGLSKEKIRQIKALAEKNGVIVLTDPDAPGNIIRHKIGAQVPGVIHAYISQDKKEQKIGVEYASPEEIVQALKTALGQFNDRSSKDEYTLEDLVKLGLSGSKESSEKRDKVGRLIGIGHINGKQFLKRLNAMGISREELIKAVEKTDGQ